MTDQTDNFEFKSIEEVLGAFAYFVTAELHTVKQLTIHESHMIQRAQARERRSTADFYETREPNAVDYLELRGRMLTANGGDVDPKDTGPLYINHSYLPQRECWHDFNQGDLVTYFIKNENVTSDYRTGKRAVESLPICVYNHETRMLVQCQNHFLNLSLISTSGTNPFPLLSHHNAWRAAKAIEFLIGNRTLPQQGNHPRSALDDLVCFECHARPMPVNRRASFINFIILIIFCGLLFVYGRSQGLFAW